MKYRIPTKIALQEAFDTLDLVDKKLTFYLQELNVDPSTHRIVRRTCNESTIGFCVVEHSNCIYCGYKYSE